MCPTNKRLPPLPGDLLFQGPVHPSRISCLVFFLCISWTRDLHATGCRRQKRTEQNWKNSSDLPSIAQFYCSCVRLYTTNGTACQFSQLFADFLNEESVLTWRQLDTVSARWTARYVETQTFTEFQVEQKRLVARESCASPHTSSLAVCCLRLLAAIQGSCRAVPACVDSTASKQELVQVNSRELRPKDAFPRCN